MKRSDWQAACKSITDWLEWLCPRIISVQTTPLPDPDWGTITPKQLAEFHGRAARNERIGVGLLGLPVSIRFGAILAPTRAAARLHGPPLNQLGWCNGDPQQRWSLAPVLYLGDAQPLPVPTGAPNPEAGLLWRPAIIGSLTVFEKLAWRLGRAGRLLLEEVSARHWPLTSFRHSDISAVADDLDRWLLFCMLASLERGPGPGGVVLMHARIDGLRQPLEAGLADLYPSALPACLSRLRCRETLRSGGGPPTTPAVSPLAGWHIVAESWSDLLGSSLTALHDLVRGTRLDAPDDLLTIDMANRLFDVSKKTLHRRITQGELVSYRSGAGPDNEAHRISRQAVAAKYSLRSQSLSRK